MSNAIPGGTSFPAAGLASLTIRSKKGNRLELLANEYGPRHLFVRGLVALIPLFDVIIRHLQKRVLSRSECKTFRVQKPEADALGVVRQILDLDHLGTVRIAVGQKIEARAEPQR